MKLLVASLTLATVVLNPPVSAAGLRLQKSCGEIECSIYYYCDPSQLLCRDCEPVCNSTSVKYHPDTCETYCQDFIHDNVRGYSRAADVQLAIINSIYWQQTVILVLLVVLVLLVGSIVTRSWYRFFKTRHQRRIDDKRFREKLASVQYTINKNSSLNDGNVKCITQPSAIQIRSPLPSSTTLTTQTETTLCSTNLQPATPVSLTLPLSTEEPTEDATLDYAAYVNQCLSRSPSIDANLAIQRF